MPLIAPIPPLPAPTTTSAAGPRPAPDHAPLREHARAAASTATSYTGPRRASLDSIEQGFASMEERFKPSKAEGLDIRMQFVLTGTGGGSWFVTIKDGRCTVRKGRGKDPHTTLTASAADYLKISNGEMNKILALLRGKLRVKGDMGKVRPFFACFEKRRG